MIKVEEVEGGIYMSDIATISVESKIENIIDLYEHIRVNFDNTSILESLGKVCPETSRYTIIGVLTDEILYEEKDRFYLKAKNCLSEVDWIEVLDQWVDFQNDDNLSPLQLGAIGYIGYENKTFFEKLDKKIKRDTEFPRIFLVKYKLLFVWDRVEDKGSWIYQERILEEEIKKIEIGRAHV